MSIVKTPISKHRVVHVVKPGQYRVSDKASLIRTYAGSTIVVCMYDEALGIGGVTNFIVPGYSQTDSITESESAEFGIAHIEYIIADVIKKGGTRKNLKVKLFGLGRLHEKVDLNRIESNRSFILDYIRNEKFDLITKNFGNSHYNEIVFIPERGAVYMRPVSAPEILTEIVKTEQGYIAEEESALRKQTAYVMFDNV